MMGKERDLAGRFQERYMPLLLRVSFLRAIGMLRAS